jgi:hypothetical protein
MCVCCGRGGETTRNMIFTVTGVTFWMTLYEQVNKYSHGYGRVHQLAKTSYSCPQPVTCDEILSWMIEITW